MCASDLFQKPGLKVRQQQFSKKELRKCKIDTFPMLLRWLSSSFLLVGLEACLKASRTFAMEPFFKKIINGALVDVRSGSKWASTDTTLQLLFLFPPQNFSN